ncbi:MAG: hypothetical protein L0Y35_01185 [Flammeovirgaceae bacterium]|nr:hypothetical protein [Flammeovirgaceae bacterium]
MKKLTLFFVAALMATAAYAQDQKKWFAIHEDLVIPSQNTKYVEAMKNLKAACQLHKVGVTWTTVMHDDYSYIHLSPIKNFADLDKDFFAELITKMGKDGFGKLMDAFNGCYETHSDFVVEEMTSHSYLSPPQGENFRDVLFWNVLSGKEMEAEAILLEWKKLYESKKAPEGFMSYKVVFGRAPGFAIVSWGKDRVESATKAQKSWELMSKEAEDLVKRTLAITTKWSTKRGDVLPDFSLWPVTPTASK